MKLTLFGVRSLVFYMTVVAAYFSAPYVNLFFLLLAFLTIHWALAFVWTRRSLVGLSVQMDELSAVQAETDASVKARLDAERRRLFDVNVTLELGRPKAKQSLLRRLPFVGQLFPLRREVDPTGYCQVLTDRGSLDVRIPRLPRGIYPVDGIRAWSTYPFGLFRRSATVEGGPREVIVYPRAASFSDASGGRTAEDLVREMLGSAVSGEGDMQPSGLRDHREGDSLRSVHWRASARRGKLVVLEWEGGGGEGLEVVLDRRCEEQELEEALGELAALVQFAREGKDVLAIRSQDLSMTFGEGHEPFDRALRFLAGAECLGSDAGAPPSTSPTVLRLPRRSAVSA